MDRSITAAIPGGASVGVVAGRVEGVGGDGGLWGLPESAFSENSCR
jgi:hypothetical protein